MALARLRSGLLSTKEPEHEVAGSGLGATGVHARIAPHRVPFPNRHGDPGLGLECRRCPQSSSPSPLRASNVDRMGRRPCPLAQRRSERRLLWHLPPNAVVSGTRSSSTVIAGHAAMGFRVVSSAPAVSSLLSGENDRLLGWVTPRYGVPRHPRRCPCPRQHAASAWFVRAFGPAGSSPGGAATPPSVNVSASENDLSIVVALSSGSYTLRVSGDGVVLEEE